LNGKLNQYKMEKSNLGQFKESLKERTKAFAHECVKFALDLPSTYLGNHIKGQLIRASTSVAANYRASCIAQTIPLVISKLSITIEEADECEFWLEFSLDEKIGNKEKTIELIKEANEFASVLIKSRLTLQKKLL
jgi:four helix bundle protein